MSFFIDRFNRRKSPIALAAFAAALLYIVIFGLLYALLAEPLYRAVSLSTPLATTAVHSAIIAAVGTAVCCLFFFQRKKRLVPVAYAWMTFFVLIAYLLSAFYFEGVRRTNLLAVLSLFCLMPLLVGNLTAWLLYRRLDRPTGD